MPRTLWRPARRPALPDRPGTRSGGPPHGLCRGASGLVRPISARGARDRHLHGASSCPVGTRILTVEDDERIRTAVRMALEDEGWDVVEAESGESAVELFGNQPADVVLIDLMLPGMDGFELCRSIRRSSDVPIVMVTARAD